MSEQFPDPFRGVVTAVEVYAKVVQVGEQVRNVDNKVDAVTEHVNGIREVQRDHESRLRLVEADRWPHGKLTLILAALGVVVSVLALISRFGA